MPRQGFHDDQNHPHYNLVPHPYDGLAERGRPEPGKLVQPRVVGGEGTFVGMLEQCTDADPDPTLYTGGTYTPYVWGDRPIIIPELTQGGVVSSVEFATFRSFIDLRRSTGEAGRALLDIQATVSAGGSAATEVLLTIPEVDASASTRLAGIFTLSRSGDPDVFGYCNTVAGTAPMQIGFFRYDGVELGSVLTLTGGDILRVNANVYYQADAPVD